MNPVNIDMDNAVKISKRHLKICSQLNFSDLLINFKVKKCL